jgi:hypothetical protein
MGLCFVIVVRTAFSVVDYAAAYGAAQVAEIDDFDQAVVLRWSEGRG